MYLRFCSTVLKEFHVQSKFKLQFYDKLMMIFEFKTGHSNKHYNTLSFIYLFYYVFVYFT